MGPEWLDWELVFSGHAELRMEEPDPSDRLLVVVTVHQRSR
jgi:hypothetical protein